MVFIGKKGWACFAFSLFPTTFHRQAIFSIGAKCYIFKGKKKSKKKKNNQDLEVQESLSLQNKLPLRPTKNIFELLVKILLVTAQSLVITVFPESAVVGGQVSSKQHKAAKYSLNTLARVHLWPGLDPKDIFFLH